MEQVWLNVNTSNQTFTRQDAIYVDSSVAPQVSPAPAGNPIVPAGYVLQIGREGGQDTVIPFNGNYVANITPACVPYDTGGWPPDPARGQPGHTGTVFENGYTPR